MNQMNPNEAHEYAGFKRLTLKSFGLTAGQFQQTFRASYQKLKAL